jgi:CO dehydrogenase maturation factor
MIVVVEPGQRSVDTARRVFELGGQIGLRRFRVVANKIATPADEAFVRSAFPGEELLGIIPYTEELRGADREGRSVLDGLSPALLARFEAILLNVSELF